MRNIKFAEYSTGDIVTLSKDKLIFIVDVNFYRYTINSSYFNEKDWVIFKTLEDYTTFYTNIFRENG